MSFISTRLFRAFTPLINIQARTRLSQFAALEPTSSPVVFLGDSITEGGIWSEWFPELTIANRGIGGNTSAQLRDRLGSAALSADTQQVFVLIGTNDLSAGIREDTIVENVAAILAEISSRAPHAAVYLQSVMPRKAVYAARIATLNSRLEALATRDLVTFVDLWPILADSDRALRSEFTEDAVHLNGAGYGAWVPVLRPLLESTG